MREKGFPTAVGGHSLLVIFAVLCLTVFALLSLSTAQAYGRLSEASVTAVEEYYAADYMAEEIFARLRRGESVEQVTRTGDIYAYSCPVSETQVLEVELSHEGGTWTVLRWQAVSGLRAEGQETLEVWDGGKIS